MIPTRTRKTAYIITGNILQAYGRNELRGQLVSYSTVSGEIRQGILLPDKYKSDEQAMRVQVIDRINDLRNGSGTCRRKQWRNNSQGNTYIVLYIRTTIKSTWRKILPRRRTSRLSISKGLPTNGWSDGRYGKRKQN